jgi:hypothetical protein
VQCVPDRFFEVIFVRSWSEYLGYVDVVCLRELAGGLSGSFRVEDPLHRAQDVAAVLRSCNIGQHSVLVYCRDNLCHPSFHGFFRVLDGLDLFVAFLGQTGQVLLEA